MAKRKPFKHSKDRSGQTVSPVDITDYNNDDNLVAFSLRKRSGEVSVYENIAWGSVKAPVVGSRYLCKIEMRKKEPVRLSPLKRMTAMDRQVLAVASKRGKAWEFSPIERNLRKVFSGGIDVGKVAEGELVEITVSGNRATRIETNYGSVEGVAGINKLSLLQAGVTEAFPEAVIKASEACGTDADITLESGQADYRDVPLVTIDGADAKDFDDAVFAEPSKDGFRLVVAIADVGAYVGEGSPMDLEARKRGNSIYLPGMVVPMLPFALSAGLCSLQPDKARRALVAEILIDKDGDIQSYEFKRVLMKSHARLVYEDVDEFLQGGKLDAPKEVVESLQHLHSLYKLFTKQRKARGALEITGGDRRLELGDDGNIEKIGTLQQTEARKLIEEMMISANVCAARYLMANGLWAQHRNHEPPPSDKVDMFAEMMEALGYKFNRTNASGKNFNAVAQVAKDRGELEVIEGLILRSQSQAYYAPKKQGHFGLGLQDYCHFTSPIRRYADLLVHRSITEKLTKQKPSLTLTDLEAIGEVISDSERQAMNIERSAMDRISALYLRQLLDGDFKKPLRASVRSVTDFAIFVFVEDVCGDAILPFGALPRDYYKVIDNGSRLLGCDNGLILKLGDMLEVRVTEADSYAGRISVEYASGGRYLDKKEARKLAGKRQPKKSRGKPSFRRGKPKRR